MEKYLIFSRENDSALFILYAAYVWEGFYSTSITIIPNLNSHF